MFSPVRGAGSVGDGVVLPGGAGPAPRAVGPPLRARARQEFERMAEETGAFYCGSGLTNRNSLPKSTFRKSQNRLSSLSPSCSW